MASATSKRRQADYDPADEPEDEVVATEETPASPEENEPGASASPDLDLAPPVVPEPNESHGQGSGHAVIVEPPWLVAFRRVASTTPASYPPKQYVSERVVDTGRVLTQRQSVALQRITDYVMAEHPTIETRGHGKIPGHKKAHATVWLLDRLADILDTLDGQEESRPKTEAVG